MWFLLGHPVYTLADEQSPYIEPLYHCYLRSSLPRSVTRLHTLCGLGQCCTISPSHFLAKCRKLQRSARKWDKLILQCSLAHTGTCIKKPIHQQQEATCSDVWETSRFQHQNTAPEIWHRLGTAFGVNTVADWLATDICNINAHIYAYHININTASERVSEQCFTSPPTQYRLYGRR